MAIGTPTSIGTRTTNGPNSGVNATIVTTAAVTAGNRIIVAVSYWDGGAANHRCTGVSDATNGAYTRDKQFINGDDVIEIWSVNAAAGLASGATITIAFDASGAWGGILAGACQVSGIATSSYLDTTATAATTGSSWNSGSASNTTANALFFGACGTEDTTNPTTSTAVNGTELHDLYLSTVQQGMVTGYRVETTTGSRNVSGTLSNANSTANTGCLAIYAAAGGGGTTFTSTLSCSTASSATIARQAQLAKAASTASAATVARSAQIIRSAASAALASIARQAQLVKAASSPSAATIVKQAQKVLASSSASSVAVARLKVILLTLSASSSASASISFLRSRLLTLAATTAASAVLARGVRKGLTATAGSSPSVSPINLNAGGSAPPGQRPTTGVG